MRNIWSLIVVVFIFSVSASGAEFTVGGFIGRSSSLGSSGPAIPIVIKPGFGSESKIIRQDATVYGVNMSMDTSSFLFHPILGLHFVQQQVREKNVFVHAPVGNTFSAKERISLDVSSTTTFIWSSLGGEINFPRKKDTQSVWRSLIIGAGGSLIFCLDRIHHGSKYVEHYEEWSRDPIRFSEPKLVEFRHKEKDFGGSYSSGLGLGWYLLSGFKFYLSRHISLKLQIRADFGTIRVKPKEGSVVNEVRLYIGTIDIVGSFRL